jgi:Fe-S-cluster containining protein
VSGCTCADCTSACTFKPGWFMPGEAERAAEHLGTTLAELFRTKLGVDWWDDPDRDIFLLAPAVTAMDPGEEYPGNPKGTCVFFVEGRCSIHEVKTFECREYHHDDAGQAVADRHRATGHAWDGHHEQIVELLGREPWAAPYEGGSIFDRLF